MSAFTFEVLPLPHNVSAFYETNGLFLLEIEDYPKCESVLQFFRTNLSTINIDNLPQVEGPCGVTLSKDYIAHLLKLEPKNIRQYELKMLEQCKLLLLDCIKKHNAYKDDFFILLGFSLILYLIF